MTGRLGQTSMITQRLTWLVKLGQTSMITQRSINMTGKARPD